MVLTAIGCACFAPTAAAEPHLRGLDTRELTAQAGCAAQHPGQARCAAERLTFRSGGAPVRTVTREGTPSSSDAGSPAGYGPSELQSAYNLASLAATRGSGETIALVDAYDDPNAESDLADYRAHYGLPSCRAGCFTKVEQLGTRASPAGEEDWSIEISLDLDMASAICPNCHILLEEANSADLGALAEADRAAANTPGVVAISNSYGAPESEVLPQLSVAEMKIYESDYDQPGVAITASAGDNGYEVGVPAVLSSVTAVGGTSLRESAGVWSETAWSTSCEDGECIGTGGGCSKYVTKPAWQIALGSEDGGCPDRTNNDVSADADPNTGAAIYDTFNHNGGWEVVGGTSESSPTIAAFYALIGEKAGVGGASWDYAHRSYFNDVIGGSNETTAFAALCSEHSYLCESTFGYSAPTGLGTPNGELVPTVSAEAPSEVTSTSALMTGAIADAYASGSTYSFHYGTTSAYGQTTSPHSFTGDVAAATQVTGLLAGTTYHFELVVTQNGRSTVSRDDTFTTAVATSGGDSGGGSNGGSSGGSIGGSSGGSIGGSTGGSSGGSSGGSGGEPPESSASHTIALTPSGESQGSGGSPGESTSTNSTVASTPSGPPARSSSSSSASPKPAPRVSELTLTANAKVALSHERLTFTQIAFSFKLSEQASVRATIAVRVGSGAHARWRTLHTSLTIVAGAGLVRRHMNGRGALAPGLYRLTLTPSHGAPTWILLRVR